MEIYYLLALALAVVTALLLWWPLRARGLDSTQSFRSTVPVYRDQMIELVQDVALGKVPESEAASIRTEIGRRLLAENTELLPVPTTHSGATYILFALMIPAIAIPAYLSHGKPQLPDTPLAARFDNAVAKNDLVAMVAQVEKRLAEKPGEAKGWALIAPIYAEMGRFSDSANAYQNLLRLEPPTAERYAALGEALTYAGEGIVSVNAAKAFEQALKLDAGHAKATFFTAIGLKQDGRIDQARALLQNLLATASAGASWRPAVETQIASLAKAPALTDGQLKNGHAMTTGDQKEMIAGMVDGLEEKLAHNNDNIEGWLRLIRARQVLGETEKAKAALARATGIFQSRPEELSSINALAVELKLQ
jgi:cytochrome c-type biogenesis protein CcmH